MTSHGYATRLPIGCYDVIDGFYDPQKSAICSYDDPTMVIRIPDKAEKEWIVKHCRVGSESEVLTECDQLEIEAQTINNDITENDEKSDQPIE